MGDLCRPPWGDPDSWADINGSIAYLLDRYGRAFGPVVKTAQSIRVRLISLASLLEDLCRRTCPRCPDPCCLGAKVWFDTADLLVLHLNGMPVPEAQPLHAWDGICRYAGPKGCRLDRLYRPWICTWYLCPAQMNALRGSDEGKRTEVEAVVSDVKNLRKTLEEGFIRTTS